jgi:hypothetical protein
VTLETTPQAPTPTPAAGVALGFAVEDARALEHAAVPTLVFDLRVTAPDGVAIRSLLLDAQVQIPARRRRYAPAEQERLMGLFGTPDRWSTTLGTLLWARLTVGVAGFSGATTVALHVPCTYDLEVSAAQYLSSLDEGEVPLELMFSGTAFYAGPGGALQATRIGLDSEATYRMPIGVWREAMDRHFPGAAWLRLSRDSFDRMAAFRAREALTSWDQVVDRLLGRPEGRAG